MDSQFWKMFGTLFGIGAAVSFAKSLRTKKKGTEILSEMILTGFLSTSAAVLLAWKPDLPWPAVAGAASILAVLGVAFLSEKIEKAFDRLIDKYLPKNDNGA